MAKFIEWFVVLVLAMALVRLIADDEPLQVACEKAVEGMVGGTLIGVVKVCRHSKARNEGLLSLRRLKKRILGYAMEGLGGGIFVGMLAISITIFLR
jgi:hypothetical protein